MNFFTIIFLALLLAAGKLVSGQSCGSGPCTGGISNIVTDAFFNGIVNQAPTRCTGRGFYTRSAFLTAATSFPQFGTSSNANVAKREIAAFFAHITHETGHLCYIEEINGRSRSFCNANNRAWPCVAGKSYHGRGPLQLSWNFNYGPAGRDIGFNGLNDPDIVARNGVISFKTGLWFWMRACHGPITSGQGFGATIRAINGNLECNGANPNAVAARVKYYIDYCNQLGVDPGANLNC